MGAARILLIEGATHGIALERYTSTGQFAGDTWHRTLDEAHSQADFEFPGTEIRWQPIPDAIDDPLQYVVDASADA